MRRVLVVGRGFFGGLVAARLRDVGLTPVVVARRLGDVRMDAEDEASLRGVLRHGDVVVDTAGPFAARTTRLVRAAIATGCDVIDLAESLAWSEAVLALADEARSAGVRLYPACSAIAAVAGASVVASGIATPREIDLFLAPASAETASPATVHAFAGSLGLPIRTLRDGRLVKVRGYTETRAFPGGSRRGGLVENSGALLLRGSWPSVRRAELWVDPNTPLAMAALSLASRMPLAAAVARWAATHVDARPLGRHDGVFAVAVRDERRATTLTFSAPRRSYLIAVEPAVIVAESLARGASPEAGVVLPHEQVDPDVLFERLRGLGILIEIRR
jgi:saccharopine dehydrogenase-like protein